MGAWRGAATTAECLISDVFITEDAAGGRGSFTAVDATGMSTGSVLLGPVSSLNGRAHTEPLEAYF